MWPRTERQDLLGIEVPIIQAPMAGSDSPALAAAVSNAGGLGSLGLGPNPLEVARDMVDSVRAATNRAVNLNFLMHAQPRLHERVAARTRERMAPFYRALDVTNPLERLTAPFEPFDSRKLELVLKTKPGVVSFHFGLPDSGVIGRIKDSGSKVLASATTVAEARRLDASGVDAIVAQGWKAGGHRGSAHIEDEEQGVGTMALVPQVVDAVTVPVIAAGGIADGRGIAAAFALGAGGVQMGTAVLHCPESAANESYREALRNATDVDTRPSRVCSGRAARGRSNAYIEAMAEYREPLPDCPLMYGFSTPLIEAAQAQGEDMRFLLYGQAAALGRPLPAEELVKWLVEDARRVMGPSP